MRYAFLASWSRPRITKAALLGLPVILITFIDLGAAVSQSIPISDPIPAEIDEIQLTYRPGQSFPAVSLREPALPAAIPYRPAEEILDLLPPLAVAPMGSCLRRPGTRGTGFDIWASEAGQGCEALVPLRKAGRPLDGLSYQVLYLRGHVTGRVAVGLEDENGERSARAVPIGFVTGSFDITLPLNVAARSMDLRRVTALTIRLEEGSGSLTLEEARLEPARPASRPERRVGLWVWNYRDAIEHPAKLWNACLQAGCRRVAIQVPALDETAERWAAYGRLLEAATWQGLEAYALDGYPEAIQEPGILAEKIQRAVEGTGAALSGVQLDVEPYLLPGFFRDESGSERYLDLIERIKRTVAGRARVSVIVPFWFTSVSLHGRPLAFSVMDLADEVAVMSYRTDMEEVASLAEDWLRYGRMARVPVWLALETTTLPEERLVVLRRERHAALADAYLDRRDARLVWEPPSAVDGGKEVEWFRIHHRVTVNPSRITFAGRARTHVRRAIESLLQRTRHSSLAGVMIHDLDGFLALSE